MVAHEYAHAEAAYRQGDSTAYMLGRLTLNPLKHIDPFMTVILPLFLWFQSHGAYTFGGAKPVPVNPRNYRHYVRGVPALNPTLEILQRMTFYGMWWNLVLAFFNLIPIPPLDGSHVFYHLLPPGAGVQYRQLQRFGFFPILLVSYLLPGVVQFFLWPAFQLMRFALGVVGPVALPGGIPS